MWFLPHVAFSVGNVEASDPKGVRPRSDPLSIALIVGLPEPDGHRHGNVQPEGRQHQRIERLGVENAMLDLGDVHDDEREAGVRPECSA